MSKTYVIYYGWLTEEHGGMSDDARRIAGAKPPLLIAPLMTAEPDVHVNLSPRVLSAMEDAGTEVSAYVATGRGARDLALVRREVEAALERGVDGIFFDETPGMPGATDFDYYGELAELVHTQGRHVIVNPGVSRCGQRMMDFADRVMFEHGWRNAASDSAWTVLFPADRFMGVSSNEEGEAMGYHVDEARAIADTREAWSRRIGWHASTDRYARLPRWFEAYINAVQD